MSTNVSIFTHTSKYANAPANMTCQYMFIYTDVHNTSHTHTQTHTHNQTLFTQIEDKGWETQ